MIESFYTLERFKRICINWKVITTKMKSKEDTFFWKLVERLGKTNKQDVFAKKAQIYKFRTSIPLTLSQKYLQWALLAKLEFNKTFREGIMWKTGAPSFQMTVCFSLSLLRFKRDLSQLGHFVSYLSVIA